LYVHSVKWAGKKGKDIPQKVLDLFEEDGGNGLSPKREAHVRALGLKVTASARNANKEIPVKDPRPVNKKGRPFSWGFSALNNFEGCPARYAAEKFYCTVKFVENEAIKWGNRVHQAAEDHIDGIPEIIDQEALKEVKKYAELFRSKGAEAEVKIVLDRNMKPLTGQKAWFSKDAWYRGALDVVVTSGTKASYFDWKTGKNIKDDTDQLKICCAALSILRPELTEFSGKLIWTRHKEVTGGCDLDLEGVKKVWEDVLPRVKRMEDAWRSEVFNPRPSGLCKKYCAVLSCPHNGRR
jgi:hypothetical protein